MSGATHSILLLKKGKNQNDNSTANLTAKMQLKLVIVFTYRLHHYFVSPRKLPEANKDQSGTMCSISGTRSLHV